MNFYIVKDLLSGNVLVNEYEEPHSYSEYTRGGGNYNVNFLEIEKTLNYHDFPTIQLIIFESKFATKHWIEKSGYNESSYFPRKLKAIKLG